MQIIEIKRADKLDYKESEAYKTLRTNVQFSGENMKVIALTSCTPNEGKTSVSFNLARSLSEIDKKVLYIGRALSSDACGLRAVPLSLWTETV